MSPELALQRPAERHRKASDWVLDWLRRTGPEVAGVAGPIDEFETILDALDARHGAAARAAVERHVAATGQAALADLRRRV